LTQLGITFPARDATGFVDDVRLRVEGYFSRTGRSIKANVGMVLKTLVLLGATFGSYGLILFGGFAWPVMLALAMVMGLGMAGIGFAVTHDAIHGAYSHDGRINAWLGKVLDLVGGNAYMWRLTHNVIHHTYTNIDGVDEDLTVSPLLRLSPGAPRRWFHRFQHLYAFPAYGMTTLFWVFVKDYKHLLQRDLGPYRNKRHPTREVINLFGMKAAYYGWSLIIPLLVLDLAWWQVGLGYLAMHITAGLILGVIFQLAHVVENTAYPVPDDQGRMKDAWLIHEMETTANFARRNPLLTWYVGGLNHQIEHHLFPKVCSVHYPAISDMVAESARQHGVPYHEQPTLWAAIRSHYRMLKLLGSS